MISGLIEKLKRKNSKAQFLLYKKYSTMIYLLTLRYINDNDVAQSITNLSFYKIFNKIDSFTFIDVTGFESWMKKIAVNESLIYIRKNKNIEYTEELENVKTSSTITADQNLIADDYFNLIRELPAGYRIIFNLYVIEGYSHNEIAQKLQIKESTSRSQLTHARTLLKKKIEKYF